MRTPAARALGWCAWLLGMFLLLDVGTAAAVPWRVLAPDPLASDSSYASLSAKPADSLTANEMSWLLLQRNWRSERADEVRGGSGGISESWYPHRARFTDSDFARLASRPYSELSDADLAWLIAESHAQRRAPAAPPVPAEQTGSNLVGVVLIAALVGTLAAYLTVGAIFHSFFH